MKYRFVLILILNFSYIIIFLLSIKKNVNIIELKVINNEIIQKNNTREGNCNLKRTHHKDSQT